MGYIVAEPNQNAMERRIVSVAERRAALDLIQCPLLATIYGVYTMQHFGGTNAAPWTSQLLKKREWAEKTKATRDSQLRKYVRFAEEGRGVPPGEIDLVAYVAWLTYDGAVSAGSFK